MAVENEIIVAIKLVPPSNDDIGDICWQDILDSLKDRLGHAVQQMSNSDELLLLRFAKLSTAYSTVFSCLKQTKKTFDWYQCTQSKFPAQIVFHNPTKHDNFSNILRSSSATLWDSLVYEELYVTPDLKGIWYSLLKGTEMPSILFEKTDTAIFRLQFSKKTKSIDEITYPDRTFPINGKMRKCFYCGMKNHSPVDCPGKLLSPEFKGISDIGYLKIKKIHECYEEVFSDIKKFTEIIEAGISFTEVKKIPALVVFITYFDLTRVYQPRFLWTMIASNSPTWESPFEVCQSRMNNRNLVMGLDCLRVGKLHQAQKMFENELFKPFGKYFYATIGQSFIALETGKVSDMKNLLAKASTLAGNEREKVYAALLSARLAVIMKKIDSAQQVLSELRGSVYDCLDVKYFQLQLETTRGATEQTCSQLKDFVEEHPAYFIMILLDPMLIPAKDFVDETLDEIVKEKKRFAKNELRKVSETRKELIVWADASDKDLKANLEAMEEMEKKFRKSSFFDFLDIEEKCNGLNYWFQQVRKKQLEKMSKDVELSSKKYNKYNLFWQNFPYQSFFTTFKPQLINLNKHLSQVSSLFESDEGAVLRKAHDLLATIRNEFAELDNIFKKMYRMEIVAKGMLKFGKYLLIFETVFICLGIFLSSMSSFTEADVFLGGVGGSRLTLMLSIIVAPIIALLMTLTSMFNK